MFLLLDSNQVSVFSFVVPFQELKLGLSLAEQNRCFFLFSSFFSVFVNHGLLRFERSGVVSHLQELQKEPASETFVILQKRRRVWSWLAGSNNSSLQRLAASLCSSYHQLLCACGMGLSCAASLPEEEADEFMDCDELYQEVIKLTRSSATKSDVTYALCDQGVFGDRWTYRHRNRWNSHKRRRRRRLWWWTTSRAADVCWNEVFPALAGKSGWAQQWGRPAHAMRCVKQLEGAFLGPSVTAKQTIVMQFFSAK